MPTTYTHLGVVTSSQAVASVNLTGEAMFGRAFIVKDVYGELVYQPTVVNTGSSSTTVHAVAFVTDRPKSEPTVPRPNVYNGLIFGGC